jgi:hypothetical protein
LVCGNSSRRRHRRRSRPRARRRLRRSIPNPDVVPGDASPVDGRVRLSGGARWPKRHQVARAPAAQARSLPPAHGAPEGRLAILRCRRVPPNGAQSVRAEASVPRDPAPRSLPSRGIVLGANERETPKEARPYVITITRIPSPWEREKGSETGITKGRSFTRDAAFTAGFANPDPT